MIYINHIRPIFFWSCHFATFLTPDTWVEKNHSSHSPGAWDELKNFTFQCGSEFGKFWEEVAPRILIHRTVVKVDGATPKRWLSRGAMVNQYMGVAPSTFQVVYIVGWGCAEKWFSQLSNFMILFYIWGLEKEPWFSKWVNNIYIYVFIFSYIFAF